MTDQLDLTGVTPESWLCVDCGINTAPGYPTRVELERSYKTSVAMKKLSGEAPPIATLTFNDRCEVYTVRDSVWKAAELEPMSGCICIGCLEKRLGRRLNPKDFPRRHPFNSMPGTERLIERRDGVGSMSKHKATAAERRRFGLPKDCTIEHVDLHDPNLAPEHRDNFITGVRSEAARLDEIIAALHRHRDDPKYGVDNIAGLAEQVRNLCGHLLACKELFGVVIIDDYPHLRRLLQTFSRSNYARLAATERAQ